MNKKYKIFSLTTILLGLSVISSIPIIKAFTVLNKNSSLNKLEENETEVIVREDINTFWKDENYSKLVLYNADWENELTSDDTSDIGGFSKTFKINARDIIKIPDGFLIEKKNNNLNYKIKSNKLDEPLLFELWYDPMTGKTGKTDNENKNWMAAYNHGYIWETRIFNPKLNLSEVSSSTFSSKTLLSNKSTNISSIFNLVIDNQEGIIIPNANPNWTWEDQPNPFNPPWGFRKRLFQPNGGKPLFKSLIRNIHPLNNDIIFLNQNMEKRILNSFLKFNPKIKLNEDNLENDKILNLKDLENNKMPVLFLLDNNLNLLKELFDIFQISETYKTWISKKDEDNWSGVQNISPEEAKRVYQDILNFKFSNLENIKSVTHSIMSNITPIKLIPGILNSSASNKLFNKLINDNLLDVSVTSFKEISLEKYSYIYKTIVGFFATKDIKINLSRTMLNTTQEIKDIFIWKDGKFIDNKKIWRSLLERPSDVEVSQLNFKINGLTTLDRTPIDKNKSTNLISENFLINNIDFNFFIKYRVDGQNWIGGLENNDSAFNIKLNESVENIIGAKYIYTDEKNQNFNIGLNNNPLGDIIQNDFFKNNIINEINKVLRTRNSTTNVIEINSSSNNNLFGVGVKGKNEAIASVGLEKWKNVWSKFNIPLVSENDKFNPSNIPVILVNNLDGIFYSYIKINNWILEDGSSNWISDREKIEFINSLNLGGLKIVEMPLTKEERYNSVTKKWDKNGHFIIKIKTI